MILSFVELYSLPDDGQLQAETRSERIMNLNQCWELGCFLDVQGLKLINRIILPTSSQAVEVIVENARFN